MTIDVSADVAAEQFPVRQRSPRYLFIARFKATDAISGMQVAGLTTDLSEGGCCLMMRKGPFSAGTTILLEITKNGAVLSVNATVVYNLRDQILGVSFAEMSAEQAAIHAGWIKTARSLG
jgi:PilZ domain